MNSTKAPATSTARVSLSPPASLLGSVLRSWTRRSYGKEMEPLLAMLHNRKVVMSILKFESRVDRWSTVDPRLKELACAAVASQIGCTWCMDFGYYVSRTNGMQIAKLENLGGWRDSDVYSDLAQGPGVRRGDDRHSPGGHRRAGGEPARRPVRGPGGRAD